MNGKNLTPLAFAFVALAMTTAEAEAAKLEKDGPNHGRRRSLRSKSLRGLLGRAD